MLHSSLVLHLTAQREQQHPLTVNTLLFWEGIQAENKEITIRLSLTEDETVPTTRIIREKLLDLSYRPCIKGPPVQIAQAGPKTGHSPY